MSGEQREQGRAERDRGDEEAADPRVALERNGKGGYGQEHRRRKHAALGTLEQGDNEKWEEEEPSEDPIAAHVFGYSDVHGVCEYVDRLRVGADHRSGRVDD